RGVVTGGWLESRDVLGAVIYLAPRADVDAGRIGAIGFTLGGGSVLYALPGTDRIRAAIVVQPTTPSVFTQHYARALMGPLARIVTPISQLLYRIAGGPSFSFIQPALAAAGSRIPVLFVQGTGDRWGSRSDVAAMAAAAPQGST